jgi:ribose transport system substrate-binding protein
MLGPIAKEEAFMEKTRTLRLLALLTATMFVVGACTGGASQSPTSTASSAPTTATSEGPSDEPTTPPTAYKIGYSNGGGVGNGFREEQVCTAKAEALSSGQVSELITIHRVTDAAGQLSDIRDLIAADVDAIVFNPNDPAALNPALEEANAAGIRTVSVDAFVTNEDTYNLYNNQVEYAYLGATWLFEQLGGEGTVWYMRGFAGHPADTDRHTGFMRALDENPGITVVPSEEGVHTQWDPATTTQIANDFIAAGQYDSIDGIWTSGMDSQVVDAVKVGGKEFKPIVGADLGAFVAQLLTEEGLTGAAVTNTAAVGGAGVALALKLLNGETVETDPDASQPNTVLLDPVVAENTSDDGKALLESWQVDGLDPLWPLGLEIEGYTTYTPEQAVACKGPGE